MLARSFVRLNTQVDPCYTRGPKPGIKDMHFCKTPHRAPQTPSNLAILKPCKCRLSSHRIRRRSSVRSLKIQISNLAPIVHRQAAQILAPAARRGVVRVEVAEEDNERYEYPREGGEAQEPPDPPERVTVGEELVGVEEDVVEGGGWGSGPG